MLIFLEVDQVKYDIKSTCTRKIIIWITLLIIFKFQASFLFGSYWGISWNKWMKHILFGDYPKDFGRLVQNQLIY